MYRRLIVLGFLRHPNLHLLPSSQSRCSHWPLVQPLEERQQIQEPLSPRRHPLIDDPPRRVGLEALDVLADLR
jgi:hypothetical protein